nr:MAG TPA: hypothetical protein [Caudoviricetes sp.]
MLKCNVIVNYVTFYTIYAIDFLNLATPKSYLFLGNFSELFWRR